MLGLNSQDAILAQLKILYEKIETLNQQMEKYLNKFKPCKLLMFLLNRLWFVTFVEEIMLTDSIRCLIIPRMHKSTILGIKLGDKII